MKQANQIHPYQKPEYLRRRQTYPNKYTWKPQKAFHNQIKYIT